MKKICILLLSISCIANQLHAMNDEEQPAGTPATTTDNSVSIGTPSSSASTTATSSNPSTSSTIQRQRSKSQSPIGTTVNIAKDAPNLLKTATILNARKTYRENKISNAQSKSAAIRAKIELIKTMRDLKQYEALRTIENDQYWQESFANDRKHADLKRKREIKLWEQEEAKENQGFLDNALDLGKSALQATGGVVFKIGLDAGGQVVGKIIQTKLADSERFRHFVLTKHDIALQDLQKKAHELQNENTAATTALHEEQIKNIQFERWLKIEELNDLQLKKRTEKMKRYIEHLNVINNEKVSIRKEKGEHEETLQNTKDEEKKQRLKKDIKEYEDDSETLVNERKRTRKLLINEIKNDNDKMEALNKNSESVTIPDQFIVA